MFLLISTAAVAQPSHVADIAMLTGPSPLTEADLEPGRCGWDPYWNEVHPPGSYLELARDYESTLAVDPTDPRRMAAVWLQDDGRLVGSATSLDAGRTWTTEIVPDVTTCSGGIHHTSYDTRIAIGATENGPGRAYVVSTSQGQSGCCLPPVQDPRSLVSHIGVSTKTLDGPQWTEPFVIDHTSMIDYPVIAADPVSPDTAYVMWSKQPAATLFSATHDGGKTWSTPALVRTTTPGYLAVNELIVLRDGSIANMYQELAFADQSLPNNIYLSMSDDQGATWSDPEPVAETRGFGSALSVVEGEEVLFATWTAASEDGWTTIVARRGADGWKELASFDRGASPAVDIAVMSDGTLGLTGYEARGEPGTSQGKTETHAVVAHSHDGGHTWEWSDLSEAFDLSNDKEVFVGDHGSLEATPCGFAATFTGGPGVSSHGISDIFYADVQTCLPVEPTPPEVDLQIFPEHVDGNGPVHMKAIVTDGDGVGDVASASLTITDGHGRVLGTWSLDCSASPDARCFSLEDERYVLEIPDFKLSGPSEWLVALKATDDHGLSTSTERRIERVEEE